MESFKARVVQKDLMSLYTMIERESERRSSVVNDTERFRGSERRGSVVVAQHGGEGAVEHVAVDVAVVLTERHEARHPQQ
jgi:streptomycin 6-kinase